MGKKLGKTIGKVVPGIKIADKYFAGAGLPTITGEKTPAQLQQEAAAKLAADTAAQAAIVQTNANALQANSALDNTANVVAGGTADSSGMENSDLLSRRRASTVSATLGI